MFTAKKLNKEDIELLHNHALWISKLCKKFKFEKLFNNLESAGVFSKISTESSNNTRDERYGSRISRLKKHSQRYIVNKTKVITQEMKNITISGSKTESSNYFTGATNSKTEDLELEIKKPYMSMKLAK